MEEPADTARLESMYRERFDEGDLAYKAVVWEVLCERIFQRFVGPNDTVLDLGAGACEFINAIDAGRKIAVDLNPDTRDHARDAEVILTSSSDLSLIENGEVDVAFSSNLFEHLPSKHDLLLTLQESHRVLRVGGLLIVVMPNVRHLPGAYWDYFDHHIPLTDRSLAEALTISGFDVRYRLSRFLPYTVKDSRLPRGRMLVRLYLAMPFLWPLLGRQMLVIARRRPSPADTSAGVDT